MRRPAHRAALAAFAMLLVSTVAVSPARADGTSWSPVEAASARFWNSVAYGDGVWVAVDIGGSTSTQRVMRSEDDGRTWQAVSTPDEGWQAVAYGAGVWIAVTEFGSTDRVMRSVDGGRTWDAVPVANYPMRQWRSVAYRPTSATTGVWVAVGTAGEGNKKSVMRSVDGGLNWTGVDMSASSVVTMPSGVSGPERIPWYGVAVSPGGTWIATGRGGTDRGVMRSTDDGQTWHVLAGPGFSEQDSVAYGSGVWVIVARDGGVARSIDDGLTWTPAASVPEANLWNDVAYGGGIWVAVSADRVTPAIGSHIIRSTDGGVSWTPVTAPEPNSWRSVAFADGTWIAVAASGTNRVMRSVTPPPLITSEPVSGPVPPSVACVPGVVSVGATVVCSVSGGDAGIDILWRAAYNPVIAEAGVTLDASGSGEFSFVVPASALGEGLTVELVEWTAPMSLGVVGPPVPSGVPAGEGTPAAPLWGLLMALAVTLALMRRPLRSRA